MSDTLIREISRALVPGEPLLVTGPYGSGKVHLTELACRKVGLAFEIWGCEVMDESDVARVTSVRFARATCIALAEFDRLPVELQGDVRHFLAVTSHNVVAFALTHESVPADMAVLFKRHIHVLKG